jgi:hypothetical protein
MLPESAYTVRESLAIAIRANAPSCQPGLGRVKRITNGDGTFITKTYNRGTPPIQNYSTTCSAESPKQRRLIDNPPAHVMLQTYDALGRIKTETFPDNDGACYGYNAAGWVNSVKGVVNSVCTPSAGYVTNINYNARGQKTDIQYVNNVLSSFAYHPTNFRLTGRQTGSGGASHASVPLSSWVRSWTVNTPLSPPSGFSNLYAGFICIRRNSIVEGTRERRAVITAFPFYSQKMDQQKSYNPFSAYAL